MRPADFVWSEQESETRNDVSREVLTHLPTAFSFSFDVGSINGYHLTYAPATDGIGSSVGVANAKDWDATATYFKPWLDVVERETAEEDLWATVLEDHDANQKPDENEANDSFTAAELRDIKQQLGEVKSYLMKQAGKDEAQRRLIGSQIEYLVDSSERLGRKDWRLLAYGALISLAQTLLLDPSQLRHIMDLLRTVRLLVA